MRIRLSQLRQIIAEELQRKIMFEGVLDDSLSLKGAVKDTSKWLKDIATKISEQLKVILIAQNGKEVAMFLQIDVSHSTELNETSLHIFFDENTLIEAVKGYIKKGRNPPNEFVDTLLAAGSGETITKPELDDVLLTMFNDSFKPAIIKKLQDLGFTGDGKVFNASTDLGNGDQQVIVEFDDWSKKTTALTLEFSIKPKEYEKNQQPNQ